MEFRYKGMTEMYAKCINGIPRYMYGDESADTALYFGDGYKTPEEAIEAYKQEQEAENETD